MTKKYILIIGLSIFLFPTVFAATKDSTKVSNNHYSLTVGFGWTHYINTLEVYKDYATINAPGVSFKFYWEPEHRLSLGLETGFYRLYKIHGEEAASSSDYVSMSAIPLLLAARMRVVDHLFLGVGTGLAIMVNQIDAGGTKMTNNITSLSNFQLSASYIYPLNKHWQVGGDFKVVSFGKTSDVIYTLQGLCAFKF